MKKVILSIGLILLLTGCSNSVVYDFSDDLIKSAIEIKFNQDEFISYYNTYSGELEDVFTSYENTESIIESSYIDFGVVAYRDDSNQLIYYEPTSFDKDDKVYSYNYSFDFDYYNFKNNYYLKECFEYFTTYEDDEYYYYKFSGNLTCDNISNFKIMVKSDDRIISSNSSSIKNDIHSWNVKNNDNEIFFAISKQVVEKASDNNLMSTIYIIGFVLIFVLAIISLFVYRKAKTLSDN